MATQLRKRMIEDMQLRGMSKKTQDSYVRSVRKLAEHYHKSPDQITEEELRQYFLYLTNEKKLARATITIALCGIKFFYNYTSKREWPSVKLIRPKREKKLPAILSFDEVRKILRLIRLKRYRVCLSTIYSCGLRLQEGLNLQHVLPKNFQKVRYYGLFAHTNRNLLAVARYILRAPLPPPEPAKKVADSRLRCPKCNGALRLFAKIPRAGRGPPVFSCSDIPAFHC